MDILQPVYLFFVLLFLLLFGVKSHFILMRFYFPIYVYNVTMCIYINLHCDHVNLPQLLISISSLLAD